jgi:hypothetical protein
VDEEACNLYTPTTACFTRRRQRRQGVSDQEGSIKLVVRYDVEGTHRRRFVSEVCDEHTMCDEPGRWDAAI